LHRALDRDPSSGPPPGGAPRAPARSAPRNFAAIAAATAAAAIAALACAPAGCATTTGPLTREVIRPAAPDDAADAYLQDLLRRAHKLRLAERLEWRRLGHWRTTLTGFLESEADGPNFFLSPHGKTNPGAELDATLRGFFATLPANAPQEAQHPICQFPARYRWLDQELRFDPARLPKPACPRYEEFLRETAADRLTFVFSSYYMNNPASVFGHTFVRIVRRGEVSEDRRELLDRAIEFSATVDTQNALVYGVKGLLGGFPGTFRNVPYHFKVRQYNDYESRDLYEYELALTREEIDTFLAHLWELGSTFFDYFYISENCSYHLLGALEAARPSLRLLDHMHWPVIPADTIKALYANPGLVTGVRFRPSLRLQFQARLRSLDGGAQALVDELAHDPRTRLELPKPRAVEVLDAAQDLIDMRYAKALTHEVDSAPARTKQVLLERRAAMAVQSDPPSVTIPWQRQPQLGHHSRRIGVGYGLDDAGAQSLVLEGRLALHDLADPTPGYPELSQLEFLPTRLRVDLGDGHVTLDSISLVRLISLTAQTRFDRKISWKVDAGVVHVADDACDDCYAGRLVLGTGATFTFANDAVALFGTLDTHLASGPHLQGIRDLPLRAGLGPAAGVRLRLASRLVSLTTGELIWLPAQRPTALWQARSILRLGVGRVLGLGLEGTLDERALTGQALTMLYF
jgi:hypothetical protein